MNAPLFKRVAYRNLNSRQKEAFNFQKISAVLADYGFTTIRLSSDWRGADFIAQHFDGSIFLKIQLKSRLTFEKKYLKQDLYICFPHGGEWFLYPHDGFLKRLMALGKIEQTNSWTKKRAYSFPTIPRKIRELLEPYRLNAEPARGKTPIPPG